MTDIKGTRQPTIKSGETSSTSETSKTSKQSSTTTSRISKTQLDDTASQIKASKDLASTKKMDTQMQSISQKMNLLKELSADQKKELEAAKKKGSQSTELSSLATDKGAIDRGKIRHEKSNAAGPACPTTIASTCGKTDTPSMGCPERKAGGSMREKFNAAGPACPTTIASTCGKTDTPSMGCPGRTVGSRTSTRDPDDIKRDRDSVRSKRTERQEHHQHQTPRTQRRRQ